MNRKKIINNLNTVNLTIFIVGFLTMITAVGLESLDLIDVETKAAIFLIGSLLCLISLALDFLRQLLKSLFCRQGNKRT